MRARPVLAIAGGLALLAWCGWVSGFHRSTQAAEITWVVSLAVVVGVGVLFWLGRRGAQLGWPLGFAEPWPLPGRGGGRLALRGVAPWMVVIVVGAAWDALGIDTGAHEAHLTISALSQAFRALNALLLLVWMVVGIGYGAARARAPLEIGPGKRPDERALEEDGRGGAALCAAGGLAPSGGHPMALVPALLLPSSRPVGVIFWVGLLVVVFGLDVLARRSAGRVASAGDFVRFISTARWVNVVLIAAWAFAGYHLFAR